MLRGRNQLRIIFGGLVIAIAACLLQWPRLALGVEMGSLYTVQVPFDQQDPDARKNAYARAIGEVLIRVTGSEDAVESEVLQSLFPNPGRYVLQFRPGEDESLVVTLDGPAIEQVLKQAGEQVWGNDRPATLVWLAVDWGGGEREIIGADAQEPMPGASRSIDRNRLLRERMQAVAKRRGIPIVFPLVDTEDLETLSFGDIWGGFDVPVLEASRRYGTTSILVGRIRALDFDRDRWTLYFGDQERQWMGGPELAVNQLADEIAAQFAWRGDAPIETVSLSISGIDSLEAYGAVQRYLQDLNSIEGYTVDVASGDEIRFAVQVQGGRDRLATALEFSAILERRNWLDVSGFYDTTATNKPLEFIYRPYVAEMPLESLDMQDSEGNVP
jgi:hypothetical protein